MKFYMLQVDKHDEEDSAVTEIHADNANHAWEKFAVEYLSELIEADSALSLAERTASAVAALKDADDVRFILVDSMNAIR